jgi:feruloyl esterase
MRYSIALASILTCAAHAATCDSLTKLSQPPLAMVTSATVVPAGDFTPPGASGPNATLKLPEFCRVEATLAPTKDSDIKIEVWLPAKGWNNKYEAVGNGGWAGVISYSAMAEAMKRGYATSSTDTGHVGGSGSFALGHPDKLDDFGYRAVHEMVVKAKGIITAYYGSQPKYSYWNGCSTGGRQGLKEAQLYPDDFQGIIAGAPANPRTGQAFEAMWIANAVLRDPASYIPPAKYPVIHKAVLDQCDALDGVKDGVLDDPRKCKFDPQVLLCKNGDSGDCLTAPQVEAARKIYTSPTVPQTEARIFPGFLPGTELGWAGMAGGPEPNAILNDHFKYRLQPHQES